MVVIISLRYSLTETHFVPSPPTPNATHPTPPPTATKGRAKDDEEEDDMMLVVMILVTIVMMKMIFFLSDFLYTSSKIVCYRKSNK